MPLHQIAQRPGDGDDDADNVNGDYDDKDAWSRPNRGSKALMESTAAAEKCGAMPEYVTSQILRGRKNKGGSEEGRKEGKKEGKMEVEYDVTIQNTARFKCKHNGSSTVPQTTKEDSRGDFKAL